jgi:flagellar protein FliJ
MKKFIFRLEALLKLRKTGEWNLKRDLESAFQKVRQSEEQRETLQNQMATLMQEIQIKRIKGEFDLEEIYAQILGHLSSSLKTVGLNLTGQQKNVEELQKRLKLLVQGRKIIEKIREKHYTHWHVEQVQAEGALLDEVICGQQPYSFE